MGAIAQNHPTLGNTMAFLATVSPICLHSFRHCCITHSAAFCCLEYYS